MVEVQERDIGGLLESRRCSSSWLSELDKNVCVLLVPCLVVLHREVIHFVPSRFFIFFAVVYLEGT